MAYAIKYQTNITRVFAVECTIPGPPVPTELAALLLTLSPLVSSYQDAFLELKNLCQAEYMVKQVITTKAHMEGESTPSMEAAACQGWANEAMTLIKNGEWKEALSKINLCLDLADTNNWQHKDSLFMNEMEHSLLEKRCLIHMKLKMYANIYKDAKKIILRKQPNLCVAYKCLIAALCKLNKLDRVKDEFGRWKKDSPNDVEVLKAHTQVTGLIKAVQNGIDSSEAFCKIEELLGLNYDWRILTDSTLQFRPCPPGGTEEYSLCVLLRFGHCPLGEKCTDAHSEGELKEWNLRRSLLNSANETHLTQCDDALLQHLRSISSEIDALRNNQSSAVDFETDKGSKIISTSALTCRVKLLQPYAYKFQVQSTKNFRLINVCLFENTDRHYFKISRVHFNGINGEAGLPDGEAGDFNIANDQLLVIPSSLLVKSNYHCTFEISFEPSVYGTFTQVLVFDFEEILSESEKQRVKVLRQLLAEVTDGDGESNHNESELNNNTDENSTKGHDTEKRSRIYHKILGQACTWNFGNSDIVDSCEGQKVCSTKVGFALLDGRPSPTKSISVDQDILSKENYKEKMRYFLTQEERARQEILSKYNMLGTLTFVNQFVMRGAGITYAPEGTLFACLKSFRDLSEDTAVGRVILRNCNYVLISKDDDIRTAEEGGMKPKVFLCTILEKTKNVIHLELGVAICQELNLRMGESSQFHIQFQLDRASFIQQKTVIDSLKPIHLDFLFPDFTKELQIPWNPQKQWNSLVENDQFRLNNKQKEAMIAVTCGDLTPPILIIGPFGTGKTFTLAQCIKTIILQKKTRILVCTHSNSAADLYVKEYLDPLTAEIEEARPLRIYYELRSLGTVHSTVQKYCKIENGRFITPSREDILMHRVIVVTLSTSYDLINLNLDEDTFSHIILDEAAQAMESEAITPLLAAGKNTKLVLAGDYMQLSPELFSSSRHFQVSLLERLHCIYHETNPCKILLCENYRSHSAIIEFASDAFYKNKLKCGKQQPVHTKYYPLTFFCARGEDILEKDGNSYYNMAEVYEVCEKVSDLVSNWPESWGDWRDENSIGVLTAYAQQVTCIRNKLRSKGLGSISVERVLNVQGKQFRAIFISTVRISKPWVHILPEKVGQEVDLGFLSNAKLLNTALTRAQSLVAVVGDPVSLCSLGKCRMLWKDFIDICKLNNSLHGISYSQIQQNIVGTELRFTWGLNPLANDFEPTSHNGEIEKIKEPHYSVVDEDSLDADSGLALSDVKIGEDKIEVGAADDDSKFNLPSSLLQESPLASCPPEAGTQPPTTKISINLRNITPGQPNPNTGLALRPQQSEFRQRAMNTNPMPPKPKQASQYYPRPPPLMQQLPQYFGPGIRTHNTPYFTPFSPHPWPPPVYTPPFGVRFPLPFASMAQSPNYHLPQSIQNRQQYPQPFCYKPGENNPFLDRNNMPLGVQPMPYSGIPLLQMHGQAPNIAPHVPHSGMYGRQFGGTQNSVAPGANLTNSVPCQAPPSYPHPQSHHLTAQEQGITVLRNLKSALDDLDHYAGSGVGISAANIMPDVENLRQKLLNFGEVIPANCPPRQQIQSPQNQGPFFSTMPEQNTSGLPMQNVSPRNLQPLMNSTPTATTTNSGSYNQCNASAPSSSHRSYANVARTLQQQPDHAKPENHNLNHQGTQQNSNVQSGSGASARPNGYTYYAEAYACEIIPDSKPALLPTPQLVPLMAMSIAPFSSTKNTPTTTTATSTAKKTKKKNRKK